VCHRQAHRRSAITSAQRVAVACIDVCINVDTCVCEHGARDPTAIGQVSKTKKARPRFPSSGLGGLRHSMGRARGHAPVCATGTCHRLTVALAARTCSYTCLCTCLYTCLYTCSCTCPYTLATLALALKARSASAFCRMPWRHAKCSGVSPAYRHTHLWRGLAGSGNP
jgi:hypothetical protein